MVWRNLAKYQCPECFAQLERPGDIGLHRCTICNFKINDQKLNQIVTSLTQKKVLKQYTNEVENLSKLNNL